MPTSKILREYKDYNNHVIKACVAGNGKPSANTRKIKRLCQDQTTKLNVVVFENGLWSILGLDINENQTTSFSCAPNSEELNDFFGDWKEKLNKIERYSNSESITKEELLSQ